MTYQNVRDKIAATMKNLHLDKHEKIEAIATETYEDIRLITSAYSIAVHEGYSEDIVDENKIGYTTLHYLMDMVLIQSIRMHAAKYGLITELSLGASPKEDIDDDVA